MDEIKYVYEYRRISVKTALWSGWPTRGKPNDDQLQPASVIRNDPEQSFYGRGGLSICEARRGQLVGFGIAVCSFSDIFNKAKGRELARKRAKTALFALEGSMSTLSDFLGSLTQQAGDLYGSPISGYSVTVGNGQASAMISWENRGKKAAE